MSQLFQLSIRMFPALLSGPIVAHSGAGQFMRPAIGILTLVLDLSPIVSENVGHRFRREIVVEVVVDLDGRRPAACTDALHLFDREHAVGSDSLVGDAKFLPGSAQGRHCARPRGVPATDVSADLDVVFAGRLEAKHRVVCGDVADFEFGDADAVRDLGERRRRRDNRSRPAHKAAYRYEGRALDRIFLNERIKACGELRREDGNEFVACVF